MDTEPVRDWMIKHQIRPWNVSDERVLDALGAVKREEFTPAEYRGLAFADTAIPLACGQQMLKPIVEGRLLQALGAGSNHRALLIGAGSGFLSACLAHIVAHVTALEIHSELTEFAAANLARAQIHNVELCTTDFRTFTPPAGFDRIVFTGSMPRFDPDLADWINPGGRMIVITGTGPSMRAESVTRTDNHYQREGLFETVLPALENVVTPSGFRF